MVVMDGTSFLSIILFYRMGFTCGYLSWVRARILGTLLFKMSRPFAEGSWEPLGGRQCLCYETDRREGDARTY
jgi:hypothetical protein